MTGPLDPWPFGPLSPCALWALALHGLGSCVGPRAFSSGPRSFCCCCFLAGLGSGVGPRAGPMALGPLGPALAASGCCCSCCCCFCCLWLLLLLLPRFCGCFAASRPGVPRRDLGPSLCPGPLARLGRPGGRPEPFAYFFSAALAFLRRARRLYGLGHIFRAGFRPSSRAWVLADPLGTRAWGPRGLPFFFVLC